MLSATFIWTHAVYLGLSLISCSTSRLIVEEDRKEVATPLQDVQRHVELRFIGGWRPDQFALGVG